MSAEFHVRSGPDRPVLAVVGEIDLANVHELDRALTDLVAAAGGPVTVDLSATEYLDSAGIGVLFDHAGRGELHLHLPAGSTVAVAVTASGLGDVTTVHP
jgi:anti-anti-sigma factor